MKVDLEEPMVLNFFTVWELLKIWWAVVQLVHWLTENNVFLKILSVGKKLSYAGRIDSDSFHSRLMEHFAIRKSDLPPLTMSLYILNFENCD